MSLESAGGILDRIRHFAHEKLSRNDEIAPVVLTYDQNDDLLTCTWFQEMDREKIADTLFALGRGVPCESIAFVSDSYTVKTPKKKDGSDWEVGSMAYAWNNDTEDKENVVEAITVVWCDRSGVSQLASQPYRRLDGDVEWEEPTVSTVEGAEVRGFFAKATEEGMKARQDAAGFVKEHPQYAMLPTNLLQEYILATCLLMVSMNAKVVHAVPFADQSATLRTILTQVFSRAADQEVINVKDGVATNERGERTDWQPQDS